MSYASSAALAADPEYLARLSFCVLGEATVKPSAPFTDQLIVNGPPFAATVFGPSIATAPGFGEMYETGGQAAISDGDLLSAVQASWDRIAALYTPATGGTPIT